MSTDDQLPDFANYILGDSHGKLTFDTPDAYKQVALAMISQAKSTLRITSRDLDPRLFDNDEFLDAVRTLSLRSRRAHVYLLANSADNAVKNGHRIIDLSQKLSSFIEIRVQGNRFKDYNQATLLADEIGYIRRPIADRHEAEADFAAPREVREMAKEFEEMWNESVTDPNLRRLSI